MPNFRVDNDKNRLYLSFIGVINLKNAEEVKALLKEQVETLKPGFDVISDLSQADIGYVSALPVLKEIMAVLAGKKVGTVVRVVGQGSMIHQQLTNVAAQSDHYTPQYVATLAEAEELLDSQS
jgi:hypothetical protein